MTTSYPCEADRKLGATLSEGAKLSGGLRTEDCWWTEFPEKFCEDRMPKVQKLKLNLSGKRTDFYFS